MRPTTKDLANHLGMSRSTVDRVLNRRPGVKAATVKAVHDAIAELGYQRNLSAANLARQRVYRFVFLLPRAEGDFVAELHRQIDDLGGALKAENMDVSVRRILGRDQHQTAQTLSRLSTESVDGIGIMAPDSPQVRDAIMRLSERNVHVVRLISGGRETASDDFVGIDNEAAGRTAARLLGSFSARSSGRVLVLTETTSAPDSAMRRVGFDMVLQSRFPDLTALATLETHGDAERTEDILSTAFANFDDIVGVYLMGSEAAFALDALNRLERFHEITVVAHERTPKTLAHLSDGRVDALIVQDPGHVARSATRILRAKSDGLQTLAAQEAIRIEILLKENLVSQQSYRAPRD